MSTDTGITAARAERLRRRLQTRRTDTVPRRDDDAHPFDLSTGPLVRAALIRAGEDEHVLAVVLHHLGSDGWSIDVLLKDLLSVYAGRAPLPLPVRCGDYAAGERLERDLGYWHGQLAGVPPVDLPTDRPRPPERRFHGAGPVLNYGEDLARSVAELGRRFGATPYTVLPAAFQTLLYRHAGQDDFAVGSTVAGRTRPELEGIAGLFANVLDLELYLFDPDAGGLSGFFTYNTDLFAPATIERMAGHLERILRAAIALAALRYRPLARSDTDVPDTEPEDGLGLAELRRRAQEA